MKKPQALDYNSVWNFMSRSSVWNFNRIDKDVYQKEGRKSIICGCFYGSQMHIKSLGKKNLQPKLVNGVLNRINLLKVHKNYKWISCKRNVFPKLIKLIKILSISLKNILVSWSRVVSSKKLARVSVSWNRGWRENCSH